MNNQSSEAAHEENEKSLRSRADQMEERISDIKDRNLDMTQRKEERDLNIR